MKDIKLSYSSATLLKNCSQKYYLYKVAKVPKDPDAAEDNEAFNVGKAFHYILEESNHTENRLGELLAEAVKSFEVEEHAAMIHAMLLRYLRLHQNSKLKVVKCELAVMNDIFEGFIDAVMSEDSGAWWIVDLKTARTLADTTIARINHDTQLNLYSYFYKEIGEALGLDPEKFAGARYRVTTKSSLTQKAKEDYNAFVLRTAANIKSYDIIIPKEKMVMEDTYRNHVKLYYRAQNLFNGGEAPEKNMSYCDSFFRPCEYFSQCFGKTFTESKASAQVVIEGKDK